MTNRRAEGVDLRVCRKGAVLTSSPLPSEGGSGGGRALAATGGPRRPAADGPLEAARRIGEGEGT